MRSAIGIGINRERIADIGGLDLPIMRRDLLQQDDLFVFQEDNSKIVLSLGTYDRIATEQGTDLLLMEDNSKFTLTVF